MPEIEKLEVFLLRPGAPPEHLRELIRTVTAKDEIERIVKTAAGTGENRACLGPGPAAAMVDGGIRYEYRIYRSNGAIERLLADAPPP
jgi:hypothetical protein